MNMSYYAPMKIGTKVALSKEAAMVRLPEMERWIGEVVRTIGVWTQVRWNQDENKVWTERTEWLEPAIG